MWLKRIIRPFIPDRLMARYRLRQHSRQVRVEVDVLVEDERMARRWLAVLPDTYRVELAIDHGRDGGDSTGIATFGVDSEQPRAATALGERNAAAAVVGAVRPPRLVGRRRNEPVVEPLAIAVRT